MRAFVSLAAFAAISLACVADDGLSYTIVDERNVNCTGIYERGYSESDTHTAHNPVLMDHADITITKCDYDVHGIDVWFDSEYDCDHVIAVYPINVSDFCYRYRPLAWTASRGRYGRLHGDFITKGNVFVQVFHHSITNSNSILIEDKARPIGWKNVTVTNEFKTVSGGYLEGSAGAMMFFRWSDYVNMIASRYGKFDDNKWSKFTADMQAVEGSYVSGSVNSIMGAGNTATSTSAILQMYGVDSSGSLVFKNGNKASVASTLPYRPYDRHLFEFTIGGLQEYNRVDNGSYYANTISNIKLNGNSGLGLLSCCLNATSGSPQCASATSGNNVSKNRIWSFKVYYGDHDNLVMDFRPMAGGRFVDVITGKEMEYVNKSYITYVPEVTNTTKRVYAVTEPYIWSVKKIGIGDWNPCLNKSEVDREIELSKGKDFGDANHDGLITRVEAQKYLAELSDERYYKYRSQAYPIYRGFSSLNTRDGKKAALDYYGSIGIIKEN